MKISSSAFGQNGIIPSVYTCDGKNINPPLFIDGAPEDTKSLVLIVDDPDASAGDWVHWVAWNIKPDTKEIPENSVPPCAIEGMTDFGRPGYGGPCPPFGGHRYQFKTYALDRILAISRTALKKNLEKAMDGHILDKATLIGFYKKPVNLAVIK